MAESEQKEQNTFDAGPKHQFPEVVKIEPCSSNECGNGHKWPPQLAVTQCPGCGGQILMVRMINCPLCNEPTKTFRMRTDHMSQGMGVPALCKGQHGLAESNMIEMTRQAAEVCMNTWDPETGRMKGL